MDFNGCKNSSAAPTYFKSFENNIMDGGLIANNPVMDLLSEAHLYSSIEQSQVCFLYKCIIIFFPRIGHHVILAASSLSALGNSHPEKFKPST